MKKMAIRAVALVMGSLAMMPSWAAVKTLTVVPTAWTLVWQPATTSGTSTQPSSFFATNTGTSCSIRTSVYTYSGIMYLPDGATVEDMKMFYNAIALAKSTSTNITLLYDDVSCTLTWFGNN